MDSALIIMNNNKCNSTNTIIGKSICKIRKEQKLTQEDMAVYFDNHREYISRLERGLVDPRLSTLLKISNALNIKLSEIIKDCDDKTK